MSSGSSSRGARKGGGGAGGGGKKEMDPAALSLKASNTKAAETLIAEVMPERILELHKMHESLRAARHASEAAAAIAQGQEEKEKEGVEDSKGVSPPSLPPPPTSSSYPPVSTGTGEGGKEGGTEVDGIVHVNPEVFALFQRVKGLVLRLVEDLGVLKLFVRLASPAIADGSFNSAVQEDVLEVISSSRSAGLMVLQHICKYFLERAHYVVKSKKYPLVSDFRKTVEQMDRQQILSLSESVMGIRNSYLLIHDKITKNEDRLKQASKPERHSSHMVC